MTEETRTAALPSRTHLVGFDSGDSIAMRDEYTPANPGDPIELGPPSYTPGTKAKVMATHISEGDDGKPLLVLELGSIRPGKSID